MEIRNLITFTKVAETQSLSKAAKLLGYAQSTVTMQMQQLEQELGTQLYERVGKQIRITQNGQEFLSYAVSIVRMSEEALMVGKTKETSVTGSLRLGVSRVLSGRSLSACANHFLKRYPQVDLSIHTDDDHDRLLYQLRHNELDFLFILDELQTGADLIHAAKDQSVPVHFYAGSNHPLTGQTLSDPALLSHSTLIQTGQFSSMESQTESVFQLYSGQTPRRILIQDPFLALSITAGQESGNDSACIILVPDFLVQEHPAAASLTRLDIPDLECSLWKQVLCHRNKWQTAAMKAWLSEAENL